MAGTPRTATRFTVEVDFAPRRGGEGPPNLSNIIRKHVAVEADTAAEAEQVAAQMAGAGTGARDERQRPGEWPMNPLRDLPEGMVVRTHVIDWDDDDRWEKHADADSTGVMVALVPPRDTSRSLIDAGDATEPLDEQHLTLAYLGDTDGIDRAALFAAVAKWARTQRALSGKPNGWGTFNNDDEHVLYAAWDIPHIAEFRASLSHALTDAGMAPKANHGFSPHQTMKYADEPITTLPPFPEIEEVDFPEVVVAYGGDWQRFPLGGDGQGEWRPMQREASTPRLNRLYGAGIDALFPRDEDGPALTTSTPWPRASRTPTDPAFNVEDVQAAVFGGKGEVAQVDPRILYGIQGGLHRSGVAYYLSGKDQESGRTFADQESKLNAIPTIFVNKAGQHVIVAGHHRAAAALVKGEPLTARIAREGISAHAFRDSYAVGGRSAAGTAHVFGEYGERRCGGDPGRRSGGAACRILGDGQRGLGTTRRGRRLAVSAGLDGQDKLDARVAAGDSWWHACSPRRADEVRQHGAFPPDYRPRRSLYGDGVYLTTNPGETASFGTTTIPVRVPPGKYFEAGPWTLGPRGMEQRIKAAGLHEEWSAENRKAAGAFEDSPNGVALQRVLRRHGYDGIRLPRSDGSTWLLVYDPAKAQYDHAREAPMQRAAGARTASAEGWRPTKGMFSPGQPTLDPRVFDLATETMKPAVRDSVLADLDAFWRPKYGDWTAWAKPYFAGSGASYWWDSDIDMDILIGVDMDRLRAARPQNVGVSDEDIAAHLDAELKNDLDPTTAHLNGFETTYFVNPGSYDIRAIKPYAAYDLLANSWVVKPPKLPPDWGPQFFSADVWRQCESVAREAEGALAIANPQARHDACVSLFDNLHSWRHLAYTSAGAGWLDIGNVVWQYLTQHPDRLLPRLYAEKHNPAFAVTAAGADITPYFAGGVGDYVETPWVQAGHHIALDPYTWRDVPVEEISTSGLYRTQNRVYKKYLKRYQGGDIGPSAEESDLPWVVAHQDKLWVIDGHHRLVKAQMRGIPTMRAHVMHPQFAVTAAVPDTYRDLTRDGRGRVLLWRGVTEGFLSGQMQDGRWVWHSPASLQHALDQMTENFGSYGQWWGTEAEARFYGNIWSSGRPAKPGETGGMVVAAWFDPDDLTEPAHGHDGLVVTPGTRGEVARAEVNIGGHWQPLPFSGGMHVTAGPNSNTLGDDPVPVPPGELRQRRPVELDRGAVDDLKRLPGDVRKALVAAVHAIENGTADLEAKVRSLAGSFSVRLTGTWRALVYLGKDRFWHLWAVVDHDYDEAQRRWGRVSGTTSYIRLYPLPNEIPNRPRDQLLAMAGLVEPRWVWSIPRRHIATGSSPCLVVGVPEWTDAGGTGSRPFCLRHAVLCESGPCAAGDAAGEPTAQRHGARSAEHGEGILPGGTSVRHDGRQGRAELPSVSGSQFSAVSGAAEGDPVGFVMSAKLPKTQKCRYCKERATKRILHSEGMAYTPVCDAHLDKGKNDAAHCVPDGGYDPSNIVRVDEIAKTAVVGLGELPPAPGTAPIPPGHVRLWHYTSPENIDSIRQNGLDATKSRGDSGAGWGNEPSAGVWASTRQPKDGDLHGKPYVEFHAPLSDISDRAESPWRERSGLDEPGSFGKGYHHVIMNGSVPPQSIVAIHEPWHQTARYLQDNYKPQDMGQFADVHTYDPDTGKAVAWYAKQASYVKQVRNLDSGDVVPAQRSYDGEDQEITEIVPGAKYVKVTTDAEPPNTYAFTPRTRLAYQDLGPPEWQTIHTGPGRPEGAGTAADPIQVGSDLDRALELIATGKHIRLNQPQQVSTLVHRIHQAYSEAQRRGTTMPTIDLCNITVPGTNVFCHGNKGIPRVKMPQLGGVPTPGSPAALRHAHDAQPGGYVDLTDDFVGALRKHGIPVTPATRRADLLRATQNQLDGRKVSAGANRIQGGGKPKGKIFTTRDGYILDGHHTWASHIATDARDGHFGDVDVPVHEIGTDIGTALDFANTWTRHQGIPSRDITARLRRLAASPGEGEAVAEFAKAHGKVLTDPAQAHDICEPVSQEFRRTLARHGVPSEVISGVRYGDFMGHRVVEAGHFAVRVGDKVYDWTARQFDPQAPVPHITTHDEWRGRWQSLGAASTTEGVLACVG